VTKRGLLPSFMWKSYVSNDPLCFGLLAPINKHNVNSLPQILLILSFVHDCIQNILYGLFTLTQFRRHHPHHDVEIHDSRQIYCDQFSAQSREQ